MGYLNRVSARAQDVGEQVKHQCGKVAALRLFDVVLAGASVMAVVAQVAGILADMMPASRVTLRLA